FFSYFLLFLFCIFVFFFFFFQAEDGIRDFHVTGVQTCALPILAVEGSAAAGSRRVHEAVEELTGQVVSALMRRAGEGRLFHIEDVQDQVELALMRSGHHKVARAYVLYREERARERGQAATAARSE